MSASNLFARIALLSSILVNTVQADDPVKLGVPSYGGSGCPAGTASVSLSPDAQSLSILFDQYQAEAGGITGKRLDRKSCNVAIPVHVPQGYSVSVFSVDYRGFNALPFGASSQFNVEYFLAGSRGPRYSQGFFGDLNEDYIINNQLVAEAMVWSKCGTDVILRSNSSVSVQTNVANEQALTTVDSIDIEAGIIYHLQWRRCR